MAVINDENFWDSGLQPGLGYLTPVVGAITQEIIDVLAVLNALRAAIPPRTLSDYPK